ncbi:MAG TPA: PepSY-associated TM helix domain-containing protein [Methylophilaceae bacterium]|jgi:hypothetical protein
MQAIQQDKISANVQRGRTIRTLRKIHGWLGLWGALLGLLFGVSGFLLNHRAAMKIPAAKMEVSEIQLPMAQPLPANAQEFTRYIQETLDIRHDPLPSKEGRRGAPRSEARFMGKDMPQPEHWDVVFAMPHAMVRAEYVPGNQFATVRREDANIWAFISRMHKGIGANTAWVLLADSIAGAFIVLSITGILLWTKMRGSRIVLTGLVGISTVLTVWATFSMM